MSRTIEVVSMRGGAWHRIVLGGGRGNLLSLELVQELAGHLHDLESERGTKWVTSREAAANFHTAHGSRSTRPN